MANQPLDVVKVVTRTIYAAALQTAKHQNTPLTMPAYSTINEAINNASIVAGQPDSSTMGLQDPGQYNAERDTVNIGLQYLCIGNGGHRFIDGGANGIPVDLPIPHRATDSGLYSMIPFVCKPIADDLSREARTRYRLRKVLQIGGETYVAYFGRYLQMIDSTPRLTRTTIIDGNPTTTSFNPSINDLKPTKPNIDAVMNDNTYVSTTATTIIDFTEDDMRNIVEACTVLYGNANYAIISELALCSGVDKTITLQYPLSGVQTPYNISDQNLKEAIGVQVNGFISTYISVKMNMQGFQLALDLGATEPLYSEVPVSG